MDVEAQDPSIACGDAASCDSALGGGPATPSPKTPFLLTLAQRRRLLPHFPLSHSVPRVVDRSVLRGIIYVTRHGLQWRDAPPAYGRHKTHYNRFVRWSRKGDRIFAALSAEGGAPERRMIYGVRQRPIFSNQQRAELSSSRALFRLFGLCSNRKKSFPVSRISQ